MDITDIIRVLAGEEFICNDKLAMIKEMDITDIVRVLAGEE